MEYEDDELADRVVEKAPVEKETMPTETRQKKDQESHHREPRGRGPRFTEHTPSTLPSQASLTSAQTSSSEKKEKTISTRTTTCQESLVVQ